MYSGPLVGVFILKIPYGRINGECIKEEKGILLRLCHSGSSFLGAFGALLRPANKAIKTMEWPLCVCVYSLSFFWCFDTKQQQQCSKWTGRQNRLLCLANNCIMETIK